jgi:hypothetical protein
VRVITDHPGKSKVPDANMLLHENSGGDDSRSAAGLNLHEVWLLLAWVVVYV